MLNSLKDKKILKNFLYFRTLMQQQNMFASVKKKSFSHFLIALDNFPSSQSSFIQKLINLKQSSFSTLSKELESKGLITIVKDPKDSRSRLLSLSAKGRKELAQIDAEQDRQFEIRHKNISKKELSRLAEIFNAIADSHQMLPESSRAGEPPLRAAQRRFSRCLGISRGSFAGLEISTTKWHVFFLLRYAVDELSIKDLSKKLALSHNAVSTQIKKLSEQGLVRKKNSRLDARSTIVELTTKGEQQLLSYENHIINDLFETLPRKILPLVKELNLILSRFYHIFTDMEHPYVVQQFSRSKNLKNARVFMIENLVKQNHHPYAPESIVSLDGHKVYGLYRNKELVAVAQFLRGEELDLDCCAWSKKLSDKRLKKFVSYLLSARRRHKNRYVSFKPLKKVMKA